MLLGKKKNQPKTTDQLDELIANLLGTLRFKREELADLPAKDLIVLLMDLLKFKLSLSKAKIDIDGQEDENKPQVCAEELSELESLVRGKLVDV